MKRINTDSYLSSLVISEKPNESLLLSGNQAIRKSTCHFFTVRSNDFYEFSKRLANSYLFGKTTNISSNLGFLKKHSQINVKTTFEILTPLSSKQKEKLLTFLISKVNFDGGFKIGNSNVH